MLRESIIPNHVIINKARKYYEKNNMIENIKIIELLCELDMVDTKLAQILLDALFLSAEYFLSSAFARGRYFSIKIIDKLIGLGAEIPLDNNYLVKLPLKEFIEQIEYHNVPINSELESLCIKNSSIEMIDWIYDRVQHDDVKNLDNLLFIPRNCYGKGDVFEYYAEKLSKNIYIIENFMYNSIYYQYGLLYVRYLKKYIMSEELSLFALIYALYTKSTYTFDVIKLHIHENIKKYMNIDISNIKDKYPDEFSKITKYPHGGSPKDYDDIIKVARLLIDKMEFDN